MLTLKIPIEIFEQILAQARAEMPLEACGIIAGTNGTCKKLYKMTNIDQSSTHCMMDPSEQFKVTRDIRSSNLKLLAIYHSHPETPARLSEEDFRLALTPDVTYIIVSLQDMDSPVIKGFHIENGNATETLIELVKE